MLQPNPITIYLMPWGRVGSNLVNSIMAKGRNVRVYNEPLTRLDTGGRKQNLTAAEVWATQEAWLRTHIIETDHAGPIFLNLAAVHIKDPAAFKTLMEPLSPVYLIHDRHDVVATVISAMRTKAWVQEGAAIGEKRAWAIPKGASVDFKPAIDPEEFLTMTDVVTKGRQIITTLTADKNATTYYYEDLMRDMDGVITDIFAKARIPFTFYEVKSGKFGSDALENMVANASALSHSIRQYNIPTRLQLSKGA